MWAVGYGGAWSWGDGGGGVGGGHQVKKFEHVQVVITWGPRCGETDRHD